MTSCLKFRETFSRFAAKRQALQLLSRTFTNVPPASKDTEMDQEDDLRLPKVGMSADGRTLICWHPEPEHPYEHTLPMTYENTEAKEGDIPIQDRLLRQHETRFRKDGPTIEELTRITHTTKHQWFPNNKKKFRSTYVKKEREGL